MPTAVEDNRVLTIALWVLRVLMAALFLLTAFSKLSGQPMAVDEFKLVGLGDWFRVLTGGVELAGAIAVLVPTTSVFGALLLLCVAIGAFFAQALAIHMDVIHPLVIAAVLLVLIYLQRGALRARLGM